jgi:hypothetical protein
MALTRVIRGAESGLDGGVGGSGHVAYVSDSAQPVTVVAKTNDDLVYQIIEQNSTIKWVIISFNATCTI